MIAGLIILFAGGLYFAMKSSDSGLPVLGHLPDFSFTDQTGRQYGLAEMKGRLTIVDFIFTRCKGPCPMMAVEMAKQAAALRDFPAVQFLSISVDPDYDSPEVLAAYAEAIGATAFNWTFLNGPAQAVVSLSESGFRLPASTSPPEHSTRFVLVDDRGQIRGYYASEDDFAMKTLTEDSKRLARGLGRRGWRK